MQQSCKDMDIKEIINGNSSISDKISCLKKKSVSVPSWSELIKLYEPSLHKVVDDKLGLKDKKNGTEPSARLIIGLEKLLCNRINEFTFTIPVKRVYQNIDGDDTKMEIKKAIEAIYRNVHINTVNIKRGLAYYSSCEIFTMWYAVKKNNKIYGFESAYKLKCKTYSPKDGVILYPLIDELDDMVAMSFEYTKTIGDRAVTYFETFTDEKHYIWRQNLDNSSWEEITAHQTDDGEESGEDIVIAKIPGAYMFSSHCIYKDLAPLRNDAEYTISRDSNIISYNASPILKVSGGIKGDEDKNEGRRIYRVENGGDVSYVAWSQASDAVQHHVKTLLSLFWMQAQMPDISFENMKNLGNIGYDARQTLLTDAHLRVGDESGSWIEFFEREFNVIKAFLKQMNKKWEPYLDDIICEHTITPFIQNDELAEITKRLKANGGKPIESQLQSIQKYGDTDDANQTYEQIKKEDKEASISQGLAFDISNQEI